MYNEENSRKSNRLNRREQSRYAKVPAETLMEQLKTLQTIARSEGYPRDWHSSGPAINYFRCFGYGKTISSF